MLYHINYHIFQIFHKKVRDSNVYVHKIALILFLFSLSFPFISCKDDFSMQGNVDAPPQSTIVEAGSTIYSAIRLMPVSGNPTRANSSYGDGNYDTEFEDGVEDESRIDNILIIFYNNDGEYVNHFEGDVKKFTNANEYSSNQTENSDLLEKIEWGSVILVKVDVAESTNIEEIDNYVVIVNYNTELYNSLLVKVDGEISDKMLNREDLRDVTVSDYQLSYKDGNGKEVKRGFLMTTAGRYDTDGNYIWYTNKPDGNQIFYLTEKDARLNTLTAYVERLSVKIQFNLKQVETVEVLHGTDVYGLVFYPDYWGVEAQEKNSYLNKHMDRDEISEYQSENDEKENPFPADFYDWLQYYNIRCFWAMSKDYDNNNYPVKGDEKVENLPLRYYTFDGLKNENYKLTPDISSDDDDILTVTCTDKPYYTLEHTFPNSLYDSRTYNPYAIPTSVVLRGQYKVKYMGTDEKVADSDPHNPGQKEESSKDHGDDEETEENPETDKTLQKGDEISLNGGGFYIRPIDMERTDWGSNPPKSYKYSFYLEKGKKDENGNRENELLTAMLKEQYMIWQEVEEEDESEVGDAEKIGEEENEGEGGKPKEKIYKPIHNNELGIFIIANTKKRNDEKDADFYDASNTYTLKIDLEEFKKLPYGKKLYLKTKASDKYEPITSANIEEANEALQRQLGYAQYYYKGYAFFYAPIPHYSGYYAPFPEKNPFTGVFNYKKDEANANYKVDHKTGDFGVVRNHIYNVIIKKIADIGYGIPGEEIIPLPEPRPGQELHQFDMELKILPWHIYEYTFDI